MTDTSPIYLTLTFASHTERITVAWEADVLGTHTSRFNPPYSSTELPLVVRALDVLQFPNYPTPYNEEQRQLFHFSEEEQNCLADLKLWDTAMRVRADAPQHVGRTIYHALITDPTGAQALASVRNHATATNHPMVLHLRFPSDGVELAALPWELLWDEGPVPLLLSRGRLAACTRHLNLAQALPPTRPLQTPLHILAIAPQAHIPPSIRQEERTARLNAWQPLIESNQVSMEEVSPATRQAVVDAIQRRPPDIIHYYGHGRYINGEGALLFDAPGGGTSWISAFRLMPLLGTARMIVLHACRGAMVGVNDLLTGIAPSLSAAGVPLVIAMQQTIRIDAATRASGIIYCAIVEGSSVQDAVSLARQALFVEEDDQLSWYVPTLYIRSRETAPVYLTCTTPADAEATRDIQPSATTKIIIAKKKSHVHDAEMSGGEQSDQRISALDSSEVVRVKSHAEKGSQHRIEAEDESEVTDILLDDRPEKPK
jgi:hypothetical protein